MLAGVEACHGVQETTGQSPFKVTFGEKPRIGLESYVLPKLLVDAAKAEEETKGFLASQKEANEKESLNRIEKTNEENESVDEKTFLHRDQVFIEAREEAAAGQSRAAAKMKRPLAKLLKPLCIGQNTTLRVPDVDHGPTDPKNFLVVIMAECKGLYTVGCREGKFSSKFAAADLQVISENLLCIDEVPDGKIPLRTAITKATGGQGYVKCMCLSGWSSGRCSCSKKNYYAILVVTSGSHAKIMRASHTLLRRFPNEPSKLTSVGVLDLFLNVAQKRLDLWESIGAKEENRLYDL
ncbi:conserved hypothetical protein [Trichinella spiralis]|uniref:hypothetical protein n=1 Tax=Trichinella spiralis TaxID=6334 RepID=UPI0001EFEB3B|nr:conserved hypothetical protein [Trichinella spiralis]